MKTIRKMVALTSAVTMLASLAAMSASATQINNDYSVSYETLTEAVVTEDGTAVPAGAVAVTMSIEGNTGFAANTLALQIADNYNVLKTTDGKPVLEKGAVLDEFHIAVEENQNKICVATAAGFETNRDGELFTVYVTETDVSELDDTVAAIVKPEEDMTPIPLSVYATGLRGDVNGDSRINAVDASLIYRAVDQYGIGTEDYKYIQYPDLEYYPTYFRTVFPNTPGPGAVNCFDSEECIRNLILYGIDSRVVDKYDAEEILQYSASQGAGVEYKGMVGTMY